MMFHRVQRAEFYGSVANTRQVARANGHITNRRETGDTVAYEVNGIPHAQCVQTASRIKFYLLK